MPDAVGQRIECALHPAKVLRGRIDPRSDLRKQFALDFENASVQAVQRPRQPGTDAPEQQYRQAKQGEQPCGTVTQGMAGLGVGQTRGAVARAQHDVYEALALLIRIDRRGREQARSAAAWIAAIDRFDSIGGTAEEPEDRLQRNSPCRRRRRRRRPDHPAGRVEQVDIGGRIQHHRVLGDLEHALLVDPTVADQRTAGRDVHGHAAIRRLLHLIRIRARSLQAKPEIGREHGRKQPDGRAQQARAGRHGGTGSASKRYP